MIYRTNNNKILFNSKNPFHISFLLTIILVGTCNAHDRVIIRQKCLHFGKELIHLHCWTNINQNTANNRCEETDFQIEKKRIGIGRYL